jgi:hypothetical protein
VTRRQQWFILASGGSACGTSGQGKNATKKRNNPLLNHYFHIYSLMALWHDYAPRINFHPILVELVNLNPGCAEFTRLGDVEYQYKNMIDSNNNFWESECGFSPSECQSSACQWPWQLAYFWSLRQVLQARTN